MITVGYPETISIFSRQKQNFAAAEVKQKRINCLLNILSAVEYSKIIVTQEPRLYSCV